MVNSESEVLPSSLGIPADDEVEDLGREQEKSYYDIGSLFQSRASRSGQDFGWLDEDHYFAEQDCPDELYREGEWTEKYTNIDEIQVNGAKQQNWDKSKEEIRQIIAQCHAVLGKDQGEQCLGRQDFTEYFHGVNLPLFIGNSNLLVCVYLPIIGQRPNFTTDHPQMNMDDCMEEEAFYDSWKAIDNYSKPATLDNSVNSVTPLWEECQTVVNKMFRTLVIQGRSGHQSYTVDDHKLHCEANQSNHRNSKFKQTIAGAWLLILLTAPEHYSSQLYKSPSRDKRLMTASRTCCTTILLDQIRSHLLI
jgi:hypothetical protein